MNIKIEHINNARDLRKFIIEYNSSSKEDIRSFLNKTNILLVEKKQILDSQEKLYNSEDDKLYDLEEEIKTFKDNVELTEEQKYKINNYNTREDLQNERERNIKKLKEEVDILEDLSNKLQTIYNCFIDLEG